MTRDEHFNVIGIDEETGEHWHEDVFPDIRGATARAMTLGRSTTARMIVYDQDGRWCAEVSTPDAPTHS